MADIDFYTIHIVRIFTKAFTDSEILTFKNVELENLSQGHGVQHAQARQSVANINVDTKNQNPYFYASFHRLRDINV